MKIITIIGARPQFIKAAAVSRAIARYNQKYEISSIMELLVHTGQHYDDGMSAIFFRELEIPEPVYNLGIGSGSHGFQTGKMLIEIEKVLLREKPDCVLVYGDTNSTVAGAMTAAKLHIPIAHVEAGLRSFNRLMPEEINRVLTDQLSAILLCPSQIAVNNLASEGIKKGVYIIGDVMADALHYATVKASASSKILDHLGVTIKGYFLATVHRAENTDNIERFKQILKAFDELNEIIIFPIHPRTRKLIESMGCTVPSNVRLINPVGYFDMVALEQSAQMILTDSGGMQKEAYWLKVPCITMRDETEWIETVKTGWNIITGADKNRILDAAHCFKNPPEHPPLYGDGESSEKCVNLLFSCIEKA